MSEIIKRDEYGLSVIGEEGQEFHFYHTEKELNDAYLEKVCAGISTNLLIPFKTLVPKIKVYFE